MNTLNMFYNNLLLEDATIESDSLRDINSVFYNCINLVNVSVLPESIVNMPSAFNNCFSLVNSPVIPNNVTNMYRTFINCSSLTGDIIIYSTEVSNVIDCFGNTSLSKNVYIPFTYDNGVNTKTYDAFTQYYGSGQNGVTLFDLASRS